MRASGTPVALAIAASVGGLVGLLVGLGIMPLPGIGPSAGEGTPAAMVLSGLLGALSGGFFALVLCLFVLSIVSRRKDVR